MAAVQAPILFPLVPHTLVDRRAGGITLERYITSKRQQLGVM
jgi:hypothetical protein